MLEAEKAAAPQDAAPQPDMAAARDGAEKRARKGRDKAPTADA